MNQINLTQLYSVVHDLEQKGMRSSAALVRSAAEEIMHLRNELEAAEQRWQRSTKAVLLDRSQN